VRANSFALLTTRGSAASVVIARRRGGYHATPMLELPAAARRPDEELSGMLPDLRSC
jgi:hypothetical protein